MNSRSLKFRLVVWHASWLTVLFLVFGVFVYESLDFYLKRSLQEALARRTRHVADLAQRTELRGAALEQEVQNHFAPEANNRFTRIAIDGHVIYASGQPADRSFDATLVPPATVPGPGTFFERRRTSDGGALYIEVLSRAAGGKTFVVEEGESEAPIKTTLHAWLLVLVLGLMVLIGGSVLGGALLVRQSLSPVIRIIRSAERISSRNLGERLPVPDTQDELEQLSVALNHMIHRLDDSFQQTRRFLADASHELRTPLTTIQAEVQAIMDRGAGSPEIHSLADNALEEIDRLKIIVEGLLTLSRLDAGEGLIEFTPFDLHELAASTADQMCLLATDKNITVTCHPSGRVIVEGDRSRMKQVVVNLLDNAIKYTPEGGRIDVRVTQREGRAFLEISDNGIGIPQSALPLIFGRFFRVDKARSREMGGAGLGLSIVKSICIAHRGRIDVSSEVNQGTSFTVELPLAKAA